MLQNTALAELKASIKVHIECLKLASYLLWPNSFSTKDCNQHECISRNRKQSVNVLSSIRTQNSHSGMIDVGQQGLETAIQVLLDCLFCLAGFPMAPHPTTTANLLHPL